METKRENYHIVHRISDLEKIVAIQCSKGNYDANEYMRGMANGLILAWHILMRPYGSEINYIDSPEKAESE